MTVLSKWYKVAVVFALLLGLSAAVSHYAGAQQAEGEAAVRVGTYDPEAVFQQYPGYAELMEAVQTAQQELEGADQQAIMQAQQRIQELQAEVIRDFQADVDRALPDVARNAELQLVAIEVAYATDGIETVDITAQLAEAVSDAEAPAEEPAPPVPGWPAE